MVPPVRSTYAAGQFYPSEKEELLSLLENMESEAKSSGPSVASDIHGLIVPHAGYMFSGKTAMAGYLKLKGKTPEHFILIGPNHSSGPSSTSIYPSGQWDTPLGRVDVSSHVAEQIMSMSREFLPDPGAHSNEHSLEVQLPFLQYVINGMFDVTPILMGVQDKKTSVGIAHRLHELDLGIPLIISSDLNRYESLDTTIRKDSLRVDSIMSLDVNRFYRVLEKERVSACGYGPIAVLMEYTRLRRGKIDLIDHSTSYHYSGDMERVVGYASLAATY